MSKSATTVIAQTAFFGFLLASQLAYSASLPKATLELLKRNKLDPVILAGIDKELQVPPLWIEEAKKEGKLRIRSTSDAARVANMTEAPFRERYPFIDLEVSSSNAEDRVVKTLMAYKGGRVIGDVVVSVSKYLKNYKEANALADVRGLPALQQSIPEARDPEGLWISHAANTYCMAYNTKLVQSKDLPKTWQDLLTIPAWKNGNLALPNRPENWVINLWKAKGEAWTREFLGKVFDEVKPQLRKEGTSAMLQLLAAGEFHAVIPASNSGTYRAAQQGAPVDFWCPDPAPFQFSTTVALKGPNTYAAKLYLNWVLSKEGQIAREIDHAGNSIHSQLRDKEFVPFGSRLLGKPTAFTTLLDEDRLTPDVMQSWDQLWLRGTKR